ncbi:hypothetical protein GKZ90_0010335 [Flavobacterium sp. MC2016-06]|uniref:hypothetical protein n=1 Tax=Flavobacterium sp. MC2016-06 TaxID=2676308 RepID=UPI0012BAAAD0|nr:hypothetical protein [Flavobacterium sp. MC2016-06]MBU3858497.1 hypothetical protein [Flavobacterium sp. MC2016-06]
MKNLTLILFFISSIHSFSQRSEEYNKFIKEIKKNAKTDKNDQTVLNLLNDFYNQVLQSEKGDLNADIPERLQKLYSDKNAKNLQIMSMFLAYQEYISQTVAGNKETDPNFQFNLITDLENEVKNTYGKVPIIVNIFKAETLKLNGQSKEYTELISKSLVEFPDSIPLKVYKYLDTKDEKTKDDLVQNHPNHWMVQQFEIK